ncbi:uncharacterized protein VTP21DRAFT_2529 [Calcarisporiella thermophila]|uniref:uncharacterized protein n=1 Tax=Calcarisporiella thermophila TaxID=911321 RepID=UPI003742B164
MPPLPETAAATVPGDEAPAHDPPEGSKPATISDVPTNSVHPSYLGARAKVSQAFAHYAIIVIGFLIFRLVLNLGTIDQYVDDTKQGFYKGCAVLETTASNVISYPHFAVDGVNHAMIQSVLFTLSEVRKALNLALTAASATISWFINFYWGTYKCLLVLVVHGAVDVLADAVTALNQFLNSTLSGIVQNINTDIGNANKQINAAFGGISGVLNTLNIPVNIPTVNIPSVAQLQGVTLPSDVEPALRNLSNTFPALNQIDATIDRLVNTPFAQVQQLINASFDKAMQFNATPFPVPPMQQVTFCRDTLNLDVLDGIGNDLKKAIYIGIGVLCGLVILLILANGVFLYYQHSKFMARVDRWHMRTPRLNTRDDILEIYYCLRHPYLEGILYRTGGWFGKPVSRDRSLWRWFWHYVLHPPALICLGIGVLGILAVYLQIAFIESTRYAWRDPARQALGNLTRQVIAEMNAKLNTTSRQFSEGSNGVIISFENRLNQDALGWVDLTTTTLNGTLNGVMDELSQTLNTVFGTVPPILNAVKEVLNCLLVNKIRGIQAALTWIHEHVHVSLPRVPENVFMLSQQRAEDVVNQAMAPFLGASTSPDTTNTVPVPEGSVDRMIDRYEKYILSELPLYWTFVGIYGVIVLFGLIGVLYLRTHGPPKEVRSPSDKEKPARNDI